MVVTIKLLIDTESVEHNFEIKTFHNKLLFQYCTKSFTINCLFSVLR